MERKFQTHGVYADKAFIETEYSDGKEAKDTWPSCQRYPYWQSCSRHLLLRQTPAQQCNTWYFFVRSKPAFALIYDGDGKNYKITLSQANLYVRKMTVSDQISTAIEDTDKNSCPLSIH